MQKSLVSFGSILLLGFIVLFGNSIASLLLGRMSIDLTDDGLYTLSEGSRSVLSKLTEPVSIKVFISRTDGAKYPAVKIYGDRVQHLLRQYAKRSNGKLQVEIYDPRPDSEEESWAQKYGLTPLALPTGDKIFFGIAAVSASGAEESIPVIDLNRQEYLEYDISKLLVKLAGGNKQGIGILSSLRLQGEEKPKNPYQQQEAAEPWVVVSQLSNFGNIQHLNIDVSSIDPSIRTLMVVHPKELPPQTLYAIDQFVMRGGNLFVAIDPFCAADMPTDPKNPQAAMFAEKSSNLKSLLGPWGVEMIEKKAVGDRDLAAQVATAAGSAPEDFVLWLNMIRGKGGETDIISSKDMTTAKLENLLLPWAGALKINPVDGITAEPLLRSTSRAMLFDEADYRYGGGMPSTLLSKYVPGTESYIIAARLRGKFKSTFASKPDGLTGDLANQEQIKETKEPGNIIVVADVDFLSDMPSARSQNILGTRLVSLINDNIPLAGNMVENLLGSNDLINLRSRGQFSRPFTKVEEIERRAAERWQREEETFQAALNSANSRLTELQEGMKPGSEQAFNKALVDEMKQIREERAEAQERLRQVRRNLRQDKERLGQILFVMNTFLVPIVLILATFIRPRKRAER